MSAGSAVGRKSLSCKSHRTDQWQLINDIQAYVLRIGTKEGAVRAWAAWAMAEEQWPIARTFNSHANSMTALRLLFTVHILCVNSKMGGIYTFIYSVCCTA